MKNTKGMPFGYKENGKIDFLQADVVRSIFNVMIKYCDKMTDEQLEDLVDEYKDLYGEELDVAQARDNLAFEMTKRYMQVELDKTWQEYQTAKKGQKFLVPVNNRNQKNKKFFVPNLTKS